MAAKKPGKTTTNKTTPKKKSEKSKETKPQQKTPVKTTKTKAAPQPTKKEKKPIKHTETTKEKKSKKTKTTPKAKTEEEGKPEKTTKKKKTTPKKKPEKPPLEMVPPPEKKEHESAESKKLRTTILKYLKTEYIPPIVIDEIIQHVLKEPSLEKKLPQIIDKTIAAYQQNRIDPTEACGMVGAQSIGEPGTQMTLRTLSE